MPKIRKFSRSLIRCYLLGTLSAKGKIRQIEAAIITDHNFLETLEIAEDDLIEDYLDSNLTKKEREKLESKFSAIPRLIENLQLMICLRRISPRCKLNAAPDG